MIRIPTEADEEARRAYRGIGGRDRGFRRWPTGPATSSRQAEMMYLLRRQIRGLNFYLGPDCVHHVPEAVRRHHSKRFREAYQAVKRLDYDDGIIPRGAGPAKLDAREGRKHNIQLGFASQRLVAIGDALISQSTGWSAATFCPNGGSATLSSMWSSRRSPYRFCTLRRNEAIWTPNCASCAPAPASRPASTPRCIVVGLFILVRLDVDAIAVFAPNEGAALMRSVVHGFGWGIGHEIAHSVFGHRRSCKSRLLTRRTQCRVKCARAARPESTRVGKGLCGLFRLRNPDKCVGCRIPPT
jgi:hypothetical protein